MNGQRHMNASGIRRRPRLHRRGTATIELVAIIPILAGITGLMFFFGWALMNKHQVLLADRYSAWQRVETGTWPTEDKLNEIVFNERAVDVDLAGGAVAAETAADLVTEAGYYGPGPEELARELLLNLFPKGRQATVTADFDSNEALWERFSGAIRHTHSREGVTWRRDEVRCWTTLRDLYYMEMDDSLQRVPPPANNMAGMIRGLYLAHW